MLQADEATLIITNQKNGVRGQAIHHTAFDNIMNPVAALACQVHHITSNSTNTELLLGIYFIDKQQQNITFYHINKELKQAVLFLNLETAGIKPAMVSSHSLRAGEAMAAKLNGVDNDTIRKLGRWSTDIYLMYIHDQIAYLNKNVAWKMAQIVPFRNITDCSLYPSSQP